MDTKDTTETFRFEIRIGAMCDKLGTQLKKHKLRFDPATMKLYDGHVMAISRLSVHGLISSAEKTKAFKRLMDKITKHIMENN